MQYEMPKVWKYPSPIRMRIDPLRRETLGSRGLGTSFGYGFRGQLLVSKGKIPEVVSKHWTISRYLSPVTIWITSGLPTTMEMAKLFIS